MAGKIGNLSVLNIFRHEPDGITKISIMRGTPLGNAYKIGLQGPDGNTLENKQDVQNAYRVWFQYMLDTQVPHFIEELDTIAFKLLDGHDVYLIEMNEYHGEVIKQIIEDQINEHLNSK